MHILIAIINPMTVSGTVQLMEVGAYHRGRGRVGVYFPCFTMVDAGSNNAIKLPPF